jgi:hypothetical protein
LLRCSADVSCIQGNIVIISRAASATEKTKHLETEMSEQKKIPRRRFFAGLGVAAAAGVAVKLAPSVVAAPAATEAEPTGTGYRLTEHIKKYYRTTNI